MNVQEFAKLAAGDVIHNDMSQSVGTVTEVSEAGVRVCWGQNGQNEPGRQPVTFFYGVNGTAWFHWRKVDVIVADTYSEGPKP